MKALYTTALILVIIGGINWGLVGFFDYNLVAMIFGEGSALARIIYGVIGLSALYILFRRLMPAQVQEKPATRV
jgi:uncharacterized membrane protein YuzA (DUF378 family)